MGWLYLSLAIVAEVAATTALKSTDSFTRPLPSVIVVVGYAVSFFLVSLALKTIPVGVAYAIWAGVGIVLVSLLGLVVHGQRLDAGAVAGITLIVVGVVVMQLFSSTAAHAHETAPRPSTESESSDAEPDRESTRSPR